jgi:hypothetical protein
MSSLMLSIRKQEIDIFSYQVVFKKATMLGFSLSVACKLLHATIAYVV